MRTMRFGAAALCFFVFLVMAAGACGSGDASSTTPTNDRGAFGECFGSSGQTCTGTQAYESCLESHCDSQAQSCFGSGYKSGNFSGGSCSAFLSCTNACACGDSSCQVACASKLTPDCETCIEGFSTCEASSSCAMPVCTGGTPDARPATTVDGGITTTVDAGTTTGPTVDGGTTGGDACSKLSACCSKFPAEGQAACNQLVALAMESVCQSALDSAGAICN